VLLSRSMGASLKPVLFVALLLALDGTSGYLKAADPAVRRTLRILTYNIHHGEGRDGELDLPRLARVMTGVDPDLVALQEVDQGTMRAGGLNELTELGHLTGMHAEFGKAMDFQGGDYGVGVLSRWPIVHADNRRLPGLPDREPRTALTVSIAMGEHEPLLTFTSTHLDQGRELGNRLVQAGFLNELLTRGAAGPSILAGDMNSRVDTEAMQILVEQWTDVFLDREPADPGRLQRRVDHVLARPAGRWRTVDSQVIDDMVASDHRPVLVVLELIGNP
jgi:endonuclease/exonuclease/phosphatase family metal-dependent hydrolase